VLHNPVLQGAMELKIYKVLTQVSSVKYCEKLKYKNFGKLLRLFGTLFLRKLQKKSSIKKTVG